MTLIRRRLTLSILALRTSCGLGVTAGGILAVAEYQSRAIDAEFQAGPWHSVAQKAVSEKDDIRGVAKDGTDLARRRMKQLTENHGGELPEVPVPDVSHKQGPPRSFDEIAPLLSVGDIVLLFGTGDMSWKITRLGYAFSGLNIDALRYSHCGVVIGPLPPACTAVMDALNKNYNNNQKSKTKTPSSSRTPFLDKIRSATEAGSGPLILEAIDNKDCNAANVLPDPTQLLHDQVLVSRLQDRVFGIDYVNNGKPARWCYNRLGIRKTDGIPWNEETVMKLEAFVAANVGRPMDKSPTLALAMVDPKLHKRVDPNITSCSEVVADALRAVNILPEGPTVHNWRERAIQPVGTKKMPKLLPSIMYAPFHFTPLGQNWMGWTYLGYYTSPATMRIGPVIRVDMGVTSKPPPPRPAATAA